MKRQTVSELVRVSQTQLHTGTIRQILADGTVEVTLDTNEHLHVACDVFEPTDLETKSFKAGDRVLIYYSSQSGSRGCILGPIGKVVHPAVNSNDSDVHHVSERIVDIQAGEKLTIRCGEGSITMTKDGTVVIRGARILSRAKGVNKVKGAAVQIN